MNNETIELRNLHRGKTSLHASVHAALELAEKRNLRNYRISELMQSGPVVRLQVGSSSSAP